MDELDNLMSEVSKNVSAATEHANNVSSYTGQLKVQLSRKQELHSRETSIALKQTAENLIHLISNNAKDVEEKPIKRTSFLEFKSNAEKRISQQDDILTVLSCASDSK